MPNLLSVIIKSIEYNFRKKVSWRPLMGCRKKQRFKNPSFILTMHTIMLVYWRYSSNIFWILHKQTGLHNVHLNLRSWTHGFFLLMTIRLIKHRCKLSLQQHRNLLKFFLSEIWLSLYSHFQPRDVSIWLKITSLQSFTCGTSNRERNWKWMLFTRRSSTFRFQTQTLGIFYAHPTHV